MLDREVLGDGGAIDLEDNDSRLGNRLGAVKGTTHDHLGDLRSLTLVAVVVEESE